MTIVPQPFGRPKICTLPAGLVRQLQRGQFDSPAQKENLENMSGIAYFVVSQGLEGAAASRLLVVSSVDQLGAEMLTCAVNGYSVVFWGAWRISDMEKLGDESKVSFEIVKSLDALVKGSGRDDVVYVLC